MSISEAVNTITTPDIRGATAGAAAAALAASTAAAAAAGGPAGRNWNQMLRGSSASDVVLGSRNNENSSVLEENSAV